jgi:internalin A
VTDEDLKIAPIISGQIRELNLNGTCVTGDFYLFKIRKLHLAGTKVRSIFFLGHADSLVEELDLSSTKVENVASLSNALKLHTLNLSKTNIQNVSGLSNLRKLIMEQCSIIRGLSSLSGVRVLNLYNTSFKEEFSLNNLFEINLCHMKKKIDLSPLSHTKRIFLACSLIEDLSQLKEVVTLDISYTNIRSVSHLTKLETLIAIKTSITDISTLTNLQTLDISQTSISDISQLTKLRILRAHETPTLDVSCLRDLRAISCGDTHITGIDQLPKLEFISANGNGFSEMLKKVTEQ